MLKLDASGTRKASLRFKKMAYNATHARPPLKQAAQRIAADNRRSYGSGPALSDTTVRIKAARGQSADPLVASGAMKGDLTDARRGTLKLTDSELLFGTRRPYARFARGTRHQPARGALTVSETTVNASAEALAKHTVSR